VGRWRAELHPRNPDGRFGTGGAAGTARVRSRTRGGDTADERVPVAGPRPGRPATLGPAEFDAAVPPAARLYRGVKRAADADASIGGRLGDGDYGPGIYLGRSIAIAQGYAQVGGGDRGGRIIRAGITDGTRRVAPPPAVQRRGGARIAAWAADNDVDVIDLGGYQVVRNPAVLIFDERTYTVDESAVLDHIAGGYPLSTLPAKYAGAAAALGYRIE
jgi:hypothetical protein